MKIKISKSNVIIATLALACAFLAFGWIREHQKMISMFPEAKEEVAEAAKTAEAANAQNGDQAPSAQNEARPPAPFSVLCAKYDEYDNKVTVRFTRRPDMRGIRRFIDVSPLNGDSFFTLTYDPVYDYEIREYVPAIVIGGDFAFGTNVTLTVRKGLETYDKGQVENTKETLNKGFTFSFRRKNLEPSVRFAAGGRYLPAIGSRLIGVESVNMRSVQADIRRVEPRNVVQLLAREEDVYYRYYGGGGDSRDTKELSGEARNVRRECKNLLNKRETATFDVGVDDNGPKNGIYLVGVGDGEKPIYDKYSYWDDGDKKYNPATYRLVCVTDLGITMREHADGFGIWLTSLSTGKPVADACVEVYSKANIRIFEGTTDASGWCVPKRIAAGEPFAVVAYSRDAADMTFMCISQRNLIDETHPDGKRDKFLKSGECVGFLSTERGIYRHSEPIFVHLLLRNDRMTAPAPFPVNIELSNSDETIRMAKTCMPDEFGAASCSNLTVAADQPGGNWTLRALLPGKERKVLAEREIKVEEFAPPQIRVNVCAAKDVAPVNFSFDVAAEYLFGAPAHDLPCEGAVVFEDVPFAPKEWAGYLFGNPELGLKPCFRTLDTVLLDRDGKARFAAPIFADSGKPRAMVRATAQGGVIEDGGRVSNGRGSALLHYYPYYIGSKAKEWLSPDRDGKTRIAVALVTPDGRRVTEAKNLFLRLERIDTVYSCERNSRGYNTWNCEHIRSIVKDAVELKTETDRDTTIELAIPVAGDYVVTLEDRQSEVSFSKSFYLGNGNDGLVRARLSEPTKVKLQPDKDKYRAGETPRLVVKSPFAGYALVSVMRESERYTRIVNLTNATSVVTLDPVKTEDAPNLDVHISVLQGVEKSANRLAARACGQTAIRVMPLECELPVTVKTALEILDGGKSSLDVTVETLGNIAKGDFAVVTVVDEGINLLTGERIPNPIARFAEIRDAVHPLYDIFDSILPVDDEALRAIGIKTGGGFGAEMLGRVSPVGTRRFRPLAAWRAKVPLKDGVGKTRFELPPFVGELRVTAIAYSKNATGSGAVHQKVSPKLVILPDAPRFVAPGDDYAVSLPIYNKAGKDGSVEAKICDKRFRFDLPKDGFTNIVLRLKAPAKPGEVAIAYEAKGLGERHERTILMPVRPAVAWRESAGVCPESEWKEPKDGKWSAKTFDSPLGDYEAALRWLAEYRHGCLEQTCSRVFPIIAAGGIFNSVVTNAPDAVLKGVRRVESMVRETDFTMWPDCDCEPFDCETSLYAAHFLAAAKLSGVKLGARTEERVNKFVGKWMESNDDEVAAYAALVKTVLSGERWWCLNKLYDRRDKLNAISRARLACAFAHVNDLARAKELLSEAYEPQSVKEAAFTLMALAAVDPKSPRALKLVAWLAAKRGKERYSWGTTGDNAHALMAIGAYYQANPPKPGEKFVAWRKLELPDVKDATAESSGIFLRRTITRGDGTEADLENLRCGELLTVHLAITSSVKRVVHDLVIEDLFPGAFDPVLSMREMPEWLMRTDTRDDRTLAFSKIFELKENDEIEYAYKVRVVSPGEYVLPGASVEGMYDPELHSRTAPGRVVVRD